MEVLSEAKKKNKKEKNSKLKKIINKKTLKHIGIGGIIYSEILSKPKSMR